MKRKRHDAQTRPGTYEQLFTLIRTAPEDSASEIVRRIRQGIDAHNLLRHIQEGDLLLQLSLRPDVYYQYTLPYPANLRYLFRDSGNQYLGSILYKVVVRDRQAHRRRSITTIGGTLPDRPLEATAPSRVASDVEKPYHIPFHGACMIEPRLHAARLSRWTSITANESFMEKLLEIFFLFEYPMYPVLHKDMFLDDLNSGGTEFCSSLLVNAIFACACVRLPPLDHPALLRRNLAWLPCH